MTSYGTILKMHQQMHQKYVRIGFFWGRFVSRASLLLLLLLLPKGRPTLESLLLAALQSTQPAWLFGSIGQPCGTSPLWGWAELGALPFDHSPAEAQPHLFGSLASNDSQLATTWVLLMAAQGSIVMPTLSIQIMFLFSNTRLPYSKRCRER